MSEESYEFEITEAVRKYSDMVYRLAVVNTGNSSDVDDIFQNVFLKLFIHKNSIKSEEHLKAWLIRVTINECRTHMTAAWRRKRVSLDALPEMASEEKEDLSDVTQAVLGLPEKYREVIHLFYYEDLSVREIADDLGLSEGAVKTRLRRGRSLLSKSLKGDDLV